ncbi:hypothetical protein Ancab_029658, partial [Ancistrocladus abbreviatus]
MGLTLWRWGGAKQRVGLWCLGGSTGDKGRRREPGVWAFRQGGGSFCRGRFARVGEAFAGGWTAIWLRVSLGGRNAGGETLRIWAMGIKTLATDAKS